MIVQVPVSVAAAPISQSAVKLYVSPARFPELKIKKNAEWCVREGLLVKAGGVISVDRGNSLIIEALEQIFTALLLFDSFH